MGLEIYCIVCENVNLPESLNFRSNHCENCPVLTGYHSGFSVMTFVRPVYITVYRLSLTHRSTAEVVFYYWKSYTKVLQLRAAISAEPPRIG